MTKPRIWLHIGIPKTGTTAFQSYCLMHQNLLAEQGVLYPKAGRIGVAHHNLAWAVTEVGPIIRPEIYDDLKYEIENSGAHDVIISSEVFFITPILKKLKTLLIGFEVNVLVFLRHQLVWYPSMYQQYIKQNEYRLNSSIQDAQVMSVPYAHLDYYEQLCLWGKAFGCENVKAFLYPEDDEIGSDRGEIRRRKDTIRTIFTAMGRPDLQAWKRPKDVGQTNRSLNADELELVRVNNKIDFKKEDRSRLLYELQKTSARRTHQDHLPSIYFLSEDLIKKIVGGPCVSNEQLSEFTDSPEERFFKNYPELDDEKLRALDRTLKQDGLIEIIASLYAEQLNYANYMFGFDMLKANQILYEAQIYPIVEPYIVYWPKFGDAAVDPVLLRLVMGSEPLKMWAVDGRKFRSVATQETYSSINAAVKNINNDFHDSDVMVFIDPCHITFEVDRLLSNVPDPGEILAILDNETVRCLIMRLDDIGIIKKLINPTGGLVSLVNQLKPYFTIRYPEQNTFRWVATNTISFMDKLDFDANL